MLTRALAAELAPRRIRINAVSPGPIANVPKHLQWTGRELTEPYRQAFLEHFGQSMSGVGVQSQPLPVGGRPEDVAMAVLYLCTSAARYITGADLLVDGGFLADFYHHDRGENEQGKRLRAYLRELPAEAWKSQRPEWVNRP